MKGKLYIVSTPIGNLEDISQRAARILGEVDLIACEDTRVTKKLLSHLDISRPLQSYHEHNEREKSAELVKELIEGKNIALVSDAGTPCISDPGYRLVKLASENEIEVIAVPGPSAATSALSISGLPSSGFTFIGFLPRTEKKREVQLEEIKHLTQTLIFYESPGRVLKTLDTMIQVFGDRACSVSRELTKVYEETLKGNLSEVFSELNNREKIRGEFVIIVEGDKTDSTISNTDIESLLYELNKQGQSLKDAVSTICETHGLKKNDVYQTALKIWR
ncbi:MAG: 16S rRNA (cytidine(1402)-2'-O)-methyltransferase [Candidatus Dadabacteria bacterium]|nr:16S rRNA (cytidine(1402)-2'-O)-methyltransferase [Candidatus Dadabacteria bacterium]NIS09205.1 16S rRNA (cytidine(1402)-2'-O)-methyltransferase [Candidatus Dadabacteria bacterium]NIV43189.1 16S rRNA (cytidine(1402)-2'-O)-methyltransferase [Candidatus Dadabacteria bacterium]NIY22255.1 16S rRNA (cytidine(1402)-2'-O)-methyltransferase [Candidatus Dadabacteria bacterium]